MERDSSLAWISGLALGAVGMYFLDPRCGRRRRAWARDKATRALNLSSGTVDAAMTLDTHHLLLRAVPGHAGLLLHAVLDKATSNLTLARLQLGRLDAVLEEPSP